MKSLDDSVELCTDKAQPLWAVAVSWWESSCHGYPLLLAGIEMVFWGLTEALQTAFYRVFCRAVYRQLEIL